VEAVFGRELATERNVWPFQVASGNVAGHICRRRVPTLYRDGVGVARGAAVRGPEHILTSRNLDDKATIRPRVPSQNLSTVQPSRKNIDSSVRHRPGDAWDRPASYTKEADDRAGAPPVV
jgi:hypothetical protein